MHDLKIPAEEFDIDGDAVAPGQAIGGARVLVALLNGLGLTGGRRGGRLFWRRRRGGRPRRRDIRLILRFEHGGRPEDVRALAHDRTVRPYCQVKGRRLRTLSRSGARSSSRRHGRPSSRSRGRGAGSMTSSEASRRWGVQLQGDDPKEPSCPSFGRSRSISSASRPSSTSTESIPVRRIDRPDILSSRTRLGVIPWMGPLMRTRQGTARRGRCVDPWRTLLRPADMPAAIPRKFTPMATDVASPVSLDVEVPSRSPIPWNEP